MAAADAIVTKVDRKKLARYGGHIDITEHYCVERDFKEKGHKSLPNVKGISAQSTCTIE